MSIRLDWQQDLEEESWPKHSGSPPPNRNRAPTEAWLILGLVVLVGIAAIALWRLSDRGERAARADLQESLAFAHWALQQQDQELFKSTLDSSSPAWSTHVLSDWDDLTAGAQDAPAPSIESIQLDGDLIEATIGWYDPNTGKSYMARRWFKLTNPDPLSDTAGQQTWLWTQPVADGLGEVGIDLRPNLTLTRYERDSAVASDILDQLDATTVALCERYGVDAADCHLHLKWDVLDPAGQPVPWRDLALPPLAEVIAGELTGPVFILGATVDDWHSSGLRQRLQRFFPGRGFKSSSRLAVLRPDGQPKLPDTHPGDASQPIVLPTPWLQGIDAQGQPHPAWQAHVHRLLADAVIRRAEGFILGSPEYVNIAWALHQAVLAAETNLPTTKNLAALGAATPIDVSVSMLPELSSLGAALQSRPDERALAQLANLSHFLQSAWTPEQIAALPAALGSTPLIDRALGQALGVDGNAFLRDWRNGRVEH